MAQARHSRRSRLHRRHAVPVPFRTAQPFTFGRRESSSASNDQLNGSPTGDTARHTISRRTAVAVAISVSIFVLILLALCTWKWWLHRRGEGRGGRVLKRLRLSRTATTAPESTFFPSEISYTARSRNFKLYADSSVPAETGEFTKNSVVIVTKGWEATGGAHPVQLNATILPPSKAYMHPKS